MGQAPQHPHLPPRHSWCRGDGRVPRARWGSTRAVPEAAAARAKPACCTFATTVRSGTERRPIRWHPAWQPGQLQGQLSFSLSRSGSLDNATLTLADGTSLPVVGDATGHSLQLRIALGARQALVAIGVGEQEIARCQGSIDGLVTGAAGDLGDWHATAGQQAAGQQTAGSSETRSGKKKDRANAAAGGAAGAGSTPGRAPRGGNQGAGGQGGTQGGGNPGGRGTQGAAAQTGAPATGSGATAPSCPSGETYCAYVEECRDLQTSPLDCGACGTRCPSLVCQGGICLSEEEADAAGNCLPGETFCALEDGYCADLQTDALNCGACGEQCAVNNCTGGVCGEASASLQNCAPPFAVCGDACVDTSSDARNCSACGLACGTDEVCSSALCVPAGGGGGCVTGLTSCGPTCANLQTDSLNCGACGVVCAAGETCQQGACTATTTNAPAPVCDAGLTDCGGSCVDLSSDNNNCGACGANCAGGGGTCVGGTLVC